MSEELEREAIKKFTLNKCILTSHGFDFISKNNLWDDVDLIIEKAKKSGIFIITKEYISELFDSKETFKETVKEIVKETKQNSEIKQILREEEEVQEEKIKVKEVLRDEMKEVQEEKIEISKNNGVYAKEITSELKIIEEYDKDSDGKVEDFLNYFRSRYEIMEKIIRQRIDYRDAVAIDRLKPGEDAKIIAMIKDKKEVKDLWILEVEDPTGSITVMAPKNAGEIFQRLVYDQVVGIKGKLRKNFYATEVVEPDIPVDHKFNTSKEPVNVCFISDLHVGSQLFLEKEFSDFIKWLNLKSEQREIAEKVKYVLIAGDLVDGIGIYPEQEKDLSIVDIYSQYDFLSKLIAEIPEYVEVILSMGNHDAVRNAEPQPKVDRSIAKELYLMKNVHVIGNPGRIEIHGVNVLMYHGASMDYMIRNISGMSYTSPEKVMVEYMKKRHISPIYKEIYPTSKDYLTLESIPDIMHTGHVHCNGYYNYKGVHLINSGTFQGRTKYQEELGHMPTPGNVPVMNLQTGDVISLKFSSAAYSS